jgi:hypothetical protein
MTKQLNGDQENFTRREATRLLAATAAGLLLPVTASRAQGKSESRSAPLMRAIPSSSENIPVLGLGTWRVFDVGASNAERKSLQDLRSLFVKLGGRVVDSSPMYGRAEEVIGDLANKLGLHDSLFLATKVWTTGKQSGLESMERSLARLQTKRIDLMQVHNLVDVKTHLATLRECAGTRPLCRRHPLQLPRFHRGRETSSERGVGFRADQLFADGTRG